MYKKLYKAIISQNNMFYIINIEDYVRVEPRFFGLETAKAVENQLIEAYTDYHSEEFGECIGVLGVNNVGEGIIIPGDGAAYYNSNFKLLVWMPEMHEVTYGIINEIANFGAFINLGVMQGMIHVSQTMEDYVSVSNTNTLLGKSTKRILKKGDQCIASVIGISYKGDQPKIGLTMRQPGLGKIEWIKEEKRKAKITEQKTIKTKK